MNLASVKGIVTNFNVLGEVWKYLSELTFKDFTEDFRKT